MNAKQCHAHAHAQHTRTQSSLIMIQVYSVSSLFIHYSERRFYEAILNTVKLVLV